MAKDKTTKMMRGALLLAIAGFAGKVLSATYRIPLQNLTGDKGFYVYQQVYPIIGVAMILALYGYPAAVSKLVAERRSQASKTAVAEVYAPLTVIIFVLNLLCSVTLYVVAPHLAEWVGDVTLTNTYKAAAGLFIIIPFLAMLRGVFQGHEQMLPTAVSQVVEQFFRVIIITSSAYLIFIGRLGLYDIGRAGVFASIIGMCAAILGWLFFLKRRTKKLGKQQRNSVPWMYYIRTCLSLGVIAAMGHLILLLMQLVDMFTVVPGLLRDGVSEERAMTGKGVFDRGQPLIQFGAVLGSSLSLALVPSIVKDAKSRAHATREALQVSFYFAGAASIGLIWLMPEVNRLLFMNAEGTASLRILMLSVVLTAVLITGASVLESIGYVRIVAGLIIVGFGVKWLLNWLLVPIFHLSGSALGTVLSLFILLLLIIWLLNRKVSHLHLLKIIRFTPFVFAAGTMSIFILLLKYSFSAVNLSRLSLLWFVMGAVISGAAIYLGILFCFRVFSHHQLEALPFGHRLLSIYEWLDQKKRG